MTPSVACACTRPGSRVGTRPRTPTATRDDQGWLADRARRAGGLPRSQPRDGLVVLGRSRTAGTVAGDGAAITAGDRGRARRIGVRRRGGGDADRVGADLAGGLDRRRGGARRLRALAAAVRAALPLGGHAADAVAARGLVVPDV